MRKDTFAVMKRKLQLLNFGMGLIVLFAILFQSVHSFEHLAKQLSEKQCHHKYHSHKTEINHSHHNFDKCFVCEFAFSSYIPLSKKEINFTQFSIFNKNNNEEAEINLKIDNLASFLFIEKEKNGGNEDE